MTSATFFKSLAIGTALTAALSATVLAQSGPGAAMGPGWRTQQASAGVNGLEPGARAGRGMQRMQGPGAALMTAEERAANQARMASVKTYDECKAVQAEQHAAMQARATEKGITLPAPQSRGCDMRKARGLITG
ncbi:MAG: hypothetical protein IPN53_16850 [Comamonadaceae bacterium]|nr:hypothetical protein [Comamonadaceae bacterium]